MARNRQRNRTGRPTARPDRPFPKDGGAGGRPPIADDTGAAFPADEDESGAMTASAAFGHAPAVEPSERHWWGKRAVTWLQGSWAELQRVQWPDRQQVAQATGVVLGFVVITGIFLGVADYVAGKIINAII